MGTQLREDSVWKMKVQRPVQFTVVVERGLSQSLGLELRHARNGKSLLITKILNGPMQIWNNAHANTELEVRPGDRVVGLNGVKGLAETLLQSSEGAERMTMTINRYTHV